MDNIDKLKEIASTGNIVDCSVTNQDLMGIIQEMEHLRGMCGYYAKQPGDAVHLLLKECMYSGDGNCVVQAYSRDYDNEIGMKIDGSFSMRQIDMIHNASKIYRNQWAKKRK